MRNKIIELEKEIEQIKSRNKKVELDKAWETSMFRKLTITTITYIVAYLFMSSIGIEKPILNALIPTGGYFLSTLTIPFIKNWWIERL